MLRCDILAVVALGTVCFMCTHASRTDEEIAIIHSNGVNVIDSGTHTWTVEHHGVPEHGFEGGFGNNPNEPSVQNHSFIIPKLSTVLATKGCLPLGPIGMALSRAPFYNPYTIDGKNAMEGDCQETFDDCSGRPGPNGAYHYHKHPSCIYSTNRDVHLQQMFLGVALDGYQIYGPLDDNDKIWTSGELDKCHGHTYNGRCMYRITHEFPFHGNAMLALPTVIVQTQNNQITERRRRQLEQRHCAQVEASDLLSQTCYAFCETPSDGSFDDCNTPYTVDPTVSTTKRYDVIDSSSNTVIKCSKLLLVVTCVFLKDYALNFNMV